MISISCEFILFQMDRHEGDKPTEKKKLQVKTK